MIYLHKSTTTFDKLKQEGCSESNILTMDHKPVLENSTLAAVYTVQYHYLFDLSDLLNIPGT